MLQLDGYWASASASEGCECRDADCDCLGVINCEVFKFCFTKWVNHISFIFFLIWGLLVFFVFSLYSFYAFSLIEKTIQNSENFLLTSNMKTSVLYGKWMSPEY